MQRASLKRRALIWKWFCGIVVRIAFLASLLYCECEDAMGARMSEREDVTIAESIGHMTSSIAKAAEIVGV